MVCWPLAFSLEGFLYMRFYCGDSESLDSCIQKTLSSLYPPFELTAATVLCQVLDVVEKTYRGDGLSYLIDFLIPAKRILQGLQQEACLQYCGLLFRHAGWPLCIQDKIVLQLASIDWRLLQPGDFYLQVVPYLRKTPRVVLKCLAHDQHNVEELVLPDVSYNSIFTLEWLEFINSGRMGTSLENCLLTSDGQLFRVRWDSIVHPEFIEKTSEATTISDTCPAAHEEAPLLHGEDLTIHNKEDEANHITMDPSLDIKLENSNSDIEGEYVELADVSVPRLGPQPGSLTQSIALNFKNKQKALNQRTQSKQSGDGSSHNKKMVCPSLAQTHCPLLPAKRAPFMGTHLIHQNMDTKENIVEYNSLFRQTLKEECKEEEPTFQEPADISYGPSNHFHHTLNDKNKIQSKSDHRETGVNRQNCEQTSSTKDYFNTSLSLHECKRHSRDCSKKSLQDPATELSPTPQSTSIDQTVSLVRSSIQMTPTIKGKMKPPNVYAQTDERVNGESEGILDEVCPQSDTSGKSRARTALHHRAAVPNCIHGILLLVEKELALSAEKPHGVQLDLLTSTKSLHKHIDASQLPPEFDGSFPYCHRDWLAFRMKLEHLQEACRDACIFLQNAIKNLHVGALPDKATVANQMLQRFGHLMRTVLEDTRLVKLQTEGGAILARLRKEESCVTLTDDYRDAVESATDLYNKVDEGVHSLVKLSNKRIQDMEVVIEFEAFEERFQEISGWIETVGMRLLGECSDTQDSLEVVLQAQRHFREFESVACEYCRRGREILQPMERWENMLLSLEVKKYLLKLQKCKEKVGEFSARLEESRQRLERTVRLYQFFDKAYEWALDGMRHLASISLDDCNSPDLCGAALESLERYQVQHAEIDEKVFVEMRELACELNSESGAKQWKFAWSKCQEARHVFEKKMEAALRTKKLAAAEQHCTGSMCPRRLSESMGEKMHSNTDSNLSHFQNQPLGSPLGPRERRLGRVLGNRTEFGNIIEQAPYKSSPLSSVSSAVSSAFRTRKMSLQSIPGDELRLDFQHQDSSISSIAAATSRPLTRRLLRKAQSFDLPGSEGGSHGCQRRLSEPGRRGNTGVFIKGLEVSSTELAERACSPRQPPPLDWSADRMVSERRSSISSPDGRSRSSKLRHIIDEMVTTEREYVRSLWYISENYFPEMERLDLPQDLRGKRGIIFGNLEKLRDFHSQYFLKELESCCNHPLRASHCFLRHKDQFGMYALYSKNKPRSDQLLASHGNIFFKNKQRQLGDKMDLASYLLKPIQRMSKYALLLKDLIKECGEAQEQELAYLRAAEEMVKFQLRHGNDLLAMDAIRDCDVSTWNKVSWSDRMNSQCGWVARNARDTSSFLRISSYSASPRELRGDWMSTFTSALLKRQTLG
ncbi:puratrophin-1 isoform X1 [Pelobates cultripes]|uniref:Puratrophin-1 isoform X1 n=1 Tax=Pelobates cultripes TaxID=61616 RepID=A0AAD1TEZ1_PELCU|nr:puratrophin-1 isoform X1 [Pelobates cultripes]